MGRHNRRGRKPPEPDYGIESMELPKKARRPEPYRTPEERGQTSPLSMMAAGAGLMMAGMLLGYWLGR